ncbi:MAG: hypothetical protein V1837_06080 [Candidatus Woesearchaeota archaeon]
MRDYIIGLLELAKEDKCKSCIRIQQELRRASKETEDSLLKGKINSALIDHDLHYSLGCKPCEPQARIKEFSKRPL